VRTTVRDGLEKVGSAVPGEQVDSAGQWVAGNIRWLRVVVVGLGAVVLLWGNDVSLSRWWWSLALVVVLLAVLQVLAGAGRGTNRQESAQVPPATPV
jgi:hypothetical protein